MVMITQGISFLIGEYAWQHKFFFQELKWQWKLHLIRRNWSGLTFKTPVPTFWFLFLQLCVYGGGGGYTVLMLSVSLLSFVLAGVFDKKKCLLTLI